MSAVKALQDYIFTSKYARWLPDQQRRETWNEAVDRVRRMMLEKYADCGIDDDINWAYDMVKQKKVLGSQRALQFGGKDAIKHNLKIYNCSYSPANRVRFFQECLYVLLCGVGAGFSVQKHHVDQLPDLKSKDEYFSLPEETFTIPDSIEGWADSIGVLMTSCFSCQNDNPWTKKRVKFDYSKIRPKGAPIGDGTGKAPGPEGLKRSLELTKQLIEQRILEGNSRLKPIDVYDITCHLSDAVLSGGIRRSALICLFSIDDTDMLNAKTGNWWLNNPQRQRSNNSVVLMRDEVTQEQFNDIVQNTKEFGEPGFVFVSDKYDVGYNPCFTGDTLILTKDGYRKIRELYEGGDPVTVLSPKILNKDKIDWSGEHSPLEESVASPVALTQKNAPVFKITLASGHNIKVTANHKFPTPFGVKQTYELKSRDELFTYLDPVSVKKGPFTTYWGLEQITDIRYIGHKDVYCLHEPIRNSIVANGICTGNCLEIGLFPYLVKDPQKFNDWLASTNKKLSGDLDQYGVEVGWQMCNLSTINCAKLKGTLEEKKQQFLDGCRAAAILGTLQAGFTKFPYLGEITERICEKEALIGVSMTGMMDNFETILDPTVQAEGAELVKKTNEYIAEKIGINRAARTTCLKPEGTASLTLGTLACGIHPHHYIRYIRTVQANTTEDVYNYFKKHNPQACEKSLTSNTGTDDVIYFPIEVPDGAKTKNQLDALTMLRMVKSTQINWVMNGKRYNDCVMNTIQHNVSNTVVVKDDEWEEVAQFIYDNRDYFTGVSLLSASGDKDYPQAPFCAVYTSRQIVKEYGDAALWVAGLITLAEEAFDGHLYNACMTLLNYDDGNSTLSDAKDDFCVRAKKFADKYMDGNLKRLTYCMKDVSNWKRWCDLNSTFVTVDYTKLVETEDNTKPVDTVACAGGACLI